MAKTGNLQKIILLTFSVRKKLSPNDFKKLLLAAGTITHLVTFCAYMQSVLLSSVLLCAL